MCLENEWSQKEAISFGSSNRRTENYNQAFDCNAKWFGERNHRSWKERKRSLRKYEVISNIVWKSRRIKKEIWEGNYAQWGSIQIHYVWTTLNQSSKLENISLNQLCIVQLLKHQKISLGVK